MSNAPPGRLRQPGTRRRRDESLVRLLAGHLSYSQIDDAGRPLALDLNLYGFAHWCSGNGALQIERRGDLSSVELNNHITG